MKGKEKAREMSSSSNQTVCTTISLPHFSGTGSNKIKMSTDSSFPVQVRLRDSLEEPGLHLFEDLKHPQSCEDTEAVVLAKILQGGQM